MRNNWLIFEEAGVIVSNID